MPKDTFDPKIWFKKFLLFPIWYLGYSWDFWLKFAWHLFIMIYDSIGIGVILDNYIAPFRRDKTFAGYFVGITLRTIFLFVGAVMLFVSFFVLAVMIATFYVAPLVVFRYWPIFTLPYMLVYFFIYMYSEVRGRYWDRVKATDMTIVKLRHAMWVRLELDIKEADAAFMKTYSRKKEDWDEFLLFLRRNELNEHDFTSTQEWVFEAEYRKQAWKFWRDDFFVRRKGVNIAWVAGFLPELKNFSKDLTKEASEGRLPHIYGREAEIERIVIALSRPKKNNVLLVGDAGVGRNALIQAIAWLIVGRHADTSDDVERMRDLIRPLEGKRIIQLMTMGLVGSGSGTVESRFNAAMREMKSGDAILYVSEIENLLQAGVLNYMTPLLSSTQFPIIATTNTGTFNQTLSKQSGFTNEFDVIHINEPKISDALEIIKGVSGEIEKKTKGKIMFTFPALRSSIELSERYIQDTVLPEKAINVLNKSLEHRSGRVITEDTIQDTIAEISGVPVGDLDAQETDKLLNLEKLLKTQIIGQDEAVKEIARAVRRARTGISSSKRPIASLLFLGPTGVGKTLTAKTLAQVYFTPSVEGGMSDTQLSQLVDDNFITMDMSEFSEVGAVDSFSSRLVQESKSKPFSLVLVDEFEKAEDKIHNLFLQIFEEGRLTNDAGETASFQNSIIIATSNAVRGIPEGVDTEKYMRDKMEEAFRPELINRFDGIVLFDPIGEKQLLHIVDLELKKLAKRVNASNSVSLTWTQPLVNELSKLGYDPEYGARPLRRVIQDRIEDSLAQKFLTKQLQPGDSYELTVADLQ